MTAARRASSRSAARVRDEADAARWGMTGSPTVLLDGADPFAVAGAPASVSCRLYRDADCHAEGAPTVQALRRALSGTRVPQPVTAAQECCDGNVLDPIGRSG
ncbi:hypothetical protein M8Z33_03390 [Streptomyces sp. ZAF1911]|uniref:hypothetical protein n=1 Tax=Streptomyces sp. ZAF1911 TaxID=2944129 RepID=UPI00237A9D12|nr:hypothetical protein [Streptomyces sp. ZAF1911]MDD9375731.1 hypothetical protein [Streptomyces sp. ZAF1911]